MSDQWNKKGDDFPIPTLSEWEEIAEESLKGKSLAKLQKETYEGIKLQPIYTKKDVATITHIKALPGESPYVRGTSNLGYRHKPWGVSQEIGATSPKSFNEKLQYDLNRGQSVVHLKLDSDARFGVWIDNLEDFEAAVANISLTQHPFMLQFTKNSLGVYATFLAYLQKQGIERKDIVAYIGMDPFSSLAKSGGDRISSELERNVMAEVTKWSINNNLNGIRTIHVDTTAYHNAGASADQELGIAVATGVSYIREMLEFGLDINEIAPKIYFSFAIGTNFFMEIAKLRSARMIWASIISEFGGDANAQKMYIHGRTSFSTKTIFDPYVNMLRTTTEALASVIGGVDSLHVSPFDEVIRESDDFGRRIARNTQSILREESHLDKVVDPAGGSWYVEKLTEQLAEKAWEYFQTIEKEGGMYTSLQKGCIQSTIEEIAKRKQENINKRKDRIVGTNMYANLTEKPLVHKPKDKEYKSISRKSTNPIVRDAVKAFFQQDTKGIDDIVQLVLNGATISEIEEGMVANSEEEKIAPLSLFRKSENFEALRSHAEIYREKHGTLPQVLFVNLGPLPKHKARSDFSTNFFAAGGFEPIIISGFEHVEDAISSVVSSSTDIVVINGTDELYEEQVPIIVNGIKQHNSNTTIFVAGKQTKDVEEKFNKAGVDGYIHVTANCFEILNTLQQQKGVQA